MEKHRKWDVIQISFTFPCKQLKAQGLREESTSVREIIIRLKRNVMSTLDSLSQNYPKKFGQNSEND